MSSITKALIMSGESEPDYINMPLTFKALEPNSKISLNKGSGVPLRRIQYRTSYKGAWTDYTPNTELTLANKGDIVQFQNLDDELGLQREDLIHDNYIYRYISSAGSLEICGNILSMIGWSNTVKNSTLKRMFYSGNNFKYAHNFYIGLPETVLSGSNHFSTLFGSSKIETPPKLSINSLAAGCYYAMFDGCTSLSAAPELPVTTLADGCYRLMFYGCTSLSAAPELPATIIPTYGYAYMFAGCTSLSSTPDMSTITSVGQNRL